MSVIVDLPDCALISAENYFNRILARLNVTVKPELYRIHVPFKRNPIKNNESLLLLLDPLSIKIRDRYETVLPHLRKHFKISSQHHDNNCDALTVAQQVAAQSGPIASSLIGGNLAPSTIKRINSARYLFPDNCKFHQIDIMENLTKIHGKFDVIVMDPPWWNKYIRRKRKFGHDGYRMLSNNVDLINLPIDSLLTADDGVLVIWCTNSPRHLSDVKQVLLPRWGLTMAAEWYWLKITRTGEPVCPFNKPLGKQPYERIVLATRQNQNGNTARPRIQKGRLIVSVPSALHSHKPPLVDLLKPLFPSDKREIEGLELFARNLLPNWTSVDITLNFDNARIQPGQYFHNESYQSTIKNALKSIIQRHSDLLEVRQQILKLSKTKHISALLGTTGTGLCILSFWISITRRDILAIVMAIGFLVTSHLLIVSSQRHGDTFFAIYETAVELPWYEWNTTNRRLLLLLIQNSQKTIQYEFLSFVPNLEFEVQLCKFIGSAINMFIYTNQ